MVDALGTLKLGLPKGRMQEGVFQLLHEAGVSVKVGARGYRPTLPVRWLEAKILKPQNIVEMLEAGSRDVGFAGADWVDELGAHLVELLDTGLDPVRLVAAAPSELVQASWPPKRRIVVASEYERLTRAWIEKKGLDASFLRSYGATEVFPPEDADCIVDNAATGSTLKANQLEIVDELMLSSTRLYANKAAYHDPTRRPLIDRLVLLVRSVLEARRRVMVELNVAADRLEAVVRVLPAMREPTISPLHGGQGYAVKVAVQRSELPDLIPEIKNQGGSDIVVSVLSQIVP
ncbi:MAG: ATP phosphoribosyltransferase [Myxococcota bacterium]